MTERLEPQPPTRQPSRAARPVVALLRGLYAAENVALVTLVLVLVGIIAAGVVARYAFSAPLQWSDEIALGLFVWLTFIGAAVTWRTHDHLGVEILVDRLPRRLQRVVWGMNYLVILTVCLSGAWWGAELAVSNLESYTLNLELPRFFIDVAFPLGSGLMAIHTLEHAYRLRSGEIPAEMYRTLPG